MSSQGKLQGLSAHVEDVLCDSDTFTKSAMHVDSRYPSHTPVKKQSVDRVALHRHYSYQSRPMSNTYFPVASGDPVPRELPFVASTAFLPFLASSHKGM